MVGKNARHFTIPLRTLLALLAAALLQGSAAAAEQPAPQGVPFEPMVLGELSLNHSLVSPRDVDEGRMQTVDFSPNGRRWAAMVYSGDKAMEVLVDGESQGVFGDAFNCSWSGNSKHVVFSVCSSTHRRSVWTVVHNGESAVPPAAYDGHGAVADDGSVAYWRSVADGPAVTGQDSGGLKGQFLFGVAKSEIHLLGTAFTTRPPVLLADGRYAATVVATDKGQRVMCMDREGKVTWFPEDRNDPWMSDWSFSAGMKRFAFASSPGDPEAVEAGCRPRVSIDGTIVTSKFDASGVPVVSANGRLVAYKVLLDGKMGVEIHDTKPREPQWAFVGRPSIDPQGKRVAFAGYTEAEGYDEPLRMYGEADLDWRLSGMCRLVVRGLRKGPEALEPEFERIEQITWSPNGKEVAYAGRRTDGWYVAWDERLAGPFASVDQLTFDRRGRTLAFGAVDGREIRWEVLK